MLQNDARALLLLLDGQKRVDRTRHGGARRGLTERVGADGEEATAEGVCGGGRGGGARGRRCRGKRRLLQWLLLLQIWLELLLVLLLMAWQSKAGGWRRRHRVADERARVSRRANGGG